jgi:hypothetical protein
MKAASKEASGESIRDKLYKIGNVFQKCREVSTHEAIARTISLPLRHSNIDVIYIPTGLKDKITRMLKPKVCINKIDDPDSTDVYIPNILDKYAKRPDSLKDMCYADFASQYRTESTSNPKRDDENIKSYSEPISDFVDTPESTEKIELKEGFGKMKKRSRPCVIRWHTVSKLKDPEEHYLKLMQLYLPWTDESELQHVDGTYASRFPQVEIQIQEAMDRHQPYEELDLDDLEDNLDTDNDDDDDDGVDNEYVLRPGNLELNEASCNSSIPANSSTSVATMTSLLMPNDQYYSMCSKLNSRQQNLFNEIVAQIQLYRWNHDDYDPFYIFLSGGAGVGKSHLVNAIAEYAKRNLKFPSQELDQPSIKLTASTGKAAAHINGSTLHSAFSISCKSRRHKGKISSKILRLLQTKYKYLKILVLDEISMINDDIFGRLDLNLQAIMESNEPFGGISILVVGDFFQLPPVIPPSVFEDPKDGTYDALLGSRWKGRFKLYELTEIVRQVGDPEFASILSRIREGKQTKKDCDEINKLNYTDMSEDWPEDPIKLFTTNKQAAASNEDSIIKLGNHIYRIKSQDRGHIPENATLNQTANLPHILSICIDARLMLTVNIDTEDHLINGSLGTIKYIHNMSERNPLSGTIYVKFDDPVAGNKRKNNNINRDWVPIVAEVKSFSMKNDGNVNCQRKQFPGILAHAITVHKSQGSTYSHMIGSMDDGQMCRRPGMAYTMLSRAQNRSTIKLENFKSDMIQINKSALEEMIRMREECPLIIEHPLYKMNSPVVLLLNIRSWNKHITHLTSDPVYLNLCSILCFTETRVVNTHCINRISSIDTNWQDIHYTTTHGLAICYEKNKINLVNELPTTSSIEIAASVFQHNESTFILILVYRSPTSNATDFMEQFSEQVRMFQQLNLRIVIVGDFNLNLHLDGNTVLINNFKQEFAMEQKTTFTTHNDGGILDLIFDTALNENAVCWQPTAFSDHFILFYTL